jgi:selenocysteine-specific elongation factor
MQGTIAVGDSLALEPSGKRARVRNIEVFGTSHAQALAGSRVALNLAGIGRHEIARGEAAVSAGIEARSRFAVRFTPLESALAVLRRRTPVRVHLGSAEVAGTLVFERAPDEVTETSAELVLREPAVAFAGVRFVLRRPSPKMLIGGGCVAGLRAEEHAGPSPAQSAVLAVVRERGLAPIELSEIAQEANLREEIARDALAPLAARGDVIELRKPPAYVDGAAASELLERVLNRLDQAQLAEPWAMGVTSLALARTVGVAEALLVRVLALFVDGGRVTRHAGYYATPEHRPSLTPQQQALFDRLVRFDADHPFVPVKFSEVAEAVGQSTVVGATRAFDTLLGGGTFVRVGDDLYAAAQIAAIRARIAEHFYHSDSLTPAQLRDAIGSSRKHVVPLLEWLDATGLTIRTKDSRALRAQL